MAKTAKATAEKVKDSQDTQDNASQAESKKQVQSAEFAEAAESEAAARPGGQGSTDKVNILLDMDVPVTVSLGQTQIPVRRLLQLGPGSVLKLDKPVDAPADLYVKDAKFAAGDVVVVDNQFAVRIKQIIGLGDAAPDEAQT